MRTRRLFFPNFLFIICPFLVGNGCRLTRESSRDKKKKKEKVKEQMGRRDRVSFGAQSKKVKESKEDREDVPKTYNFSLSATCFVLPPFASCLVLPQLKSSKCQKE